MSKYGTKIEKSDNKVLDWNRVTEILWLKIKDLPAIDLSERQKLGDKNYEIRIEGWKFWKKYWIETEGWT